jgi:hypothetical protein
MDQNGIFLKTPADLRPLRGVISVRRDFYFYFLFLEILTVAVMVLLDMILIFFVVVVGGNNYI